MEFDQSLESVIDQLLENWLKARETKKFERKMTKAIMVGIPDSSSYGIYRFKVALSKIPTAQLQASVGRIKANLHKGEVILNTNLTALGINV